MENPYLELFNRQKNNQFKVGNTTYKERLKKLKALRYAVEVTYKDRIREALYKDFKKPQLEVDLTEIYPIVSEIKFVSANLKSWMKRQKVETPMALLGSSSWVTYEPKGVCLIVSPWNFPFNLTFGPLVSAIAAGNTVILKPSEMTLNSSRIMAEIVQEIFTEDEVALVEGAVETSKALLQLPFNHIFFTGSPAVGKIVMKAAAEHLTSVTLELGGKSPTIIDKTANLSHAVRKIAWGKFLNNGQICVSPDYILIDETVKEAFISEFKKQLKVFYTKSTNHSADYSRVVNNRHFDRLVNHIENAKQHNAIIEIGGVSNKTENFIEPTVISNLPEKASLLQEEIFGPILPIKTYGNLEEAVAYINSKEKPLALYIYSKRKSNINYIIKNTRAGTTAINNNVLQYSNHHLPFGGSNNSGIGKSHGFYGFEAFSNRRAVLKQHTKGATEFLFPPYTTMKQKLVDWTIKWF
ncbi:aldehyde dehydrogenase family protein [Mangrovimonas spongiae]|uniref:aldehyde dehydrogenase family protein n=1 Tax=Mangrovimonas spongiae TaxID=2494697 RepID=UPI001F0C318D|nr:aldehyde dehydrogenase family protein [Mangrovimonas spongiae]